MSSRDKNNDSANGYSENDYDVRLPFEIEHYERKIYDLRQLIEISKGLNSTLEYNTLIDSILYTCMGQMQLLRAGVFLKKGLGNETYSFHRNYKGFDVDHSKEYEIDSESPLLEVLQEGIRCYTRDELHRRVPSCQALVMLRELEPELIVPLMSKGILNGVIVLGERITGNPFSETEKEYLMDIASLAGIAIQNAYLYEMATTDMMTHLKIHHYFQTQLIEEIERANRTAKPLSLIMLDIDHFKEFNDTYGHTAGDAVLIEVARTIKDHVRPMDTAARYGGEEFAVILPRTDLKEAVTVAERVREAIHEQVVTYEKQALSVAVSVGLTEYNPRRDKRSTQIIERADKALYMSKQNGRNQVTQL